MVGCTRPAPPAPAKPVDAAVPDARRWSDAQLAEIARRRARLIAFHGKMRRRHYESQGHVEPPAALPTDLRGVWPSAVEAKVVSVGLHRRMRASRPDAERWRLMTRWITPLGGAEARAALEKHLRATGWLGPQEPARFPLSHPERGRLDAEFIEHPERATAVELKLDHPDPGTPLGAPSSLLAQAPGWLAAVAPQIVGFEFDWHHGVVPGGKFTDVLRFAVALEGDVTVQMEALRRRLATSGYAADAKNAEIYRDGSGATCRADIGERGLVVHHQRRWKR